MSQLFAWGGQSIGVSASASVLPVNTQDWLWIKLLLNPYEGVRTLQHPSLPLGKCQGAVAELYVKSIFIFYKKLPVFFPSSYISFCILTKNGFLLLHILVSIWWCQCFRFWPLWYACSGMSLLSFAFSWRCVLWSIFSCAYLPSV